MWMRCFSSFQRRTPRAGLVKAPVTYDHFTKFDAARASRKQHQLATMDDQPLRETRRLLVLSLQEIAATFPKYASSLGSQSVTSIPPESSTLDADTPQPRRDSLHITPQIQDEQSNPTVELSTESRSEDSPKQARKNTTGEAPLWNAIRRQDLKLTIRLFLEAQKSNQRLSRRLLVRLFYLIVPTDPLLAYSTLKQFRTKENLTDTELKMYFKLCSSLSSLNQLKYNRRALYDFVNHLIHDLETLERDAQQELLPKLITALATQRNVRIGAYARKLYQYMVDNDFEMKTGWLRQLLSLSKYNRQDDLPFHDVMQRLAAENGRPHPLSVIQAIHNMFPFTESEDVCMAIRAYLDFQKKLVLEDFPQPTTLDEIQIDLDCLESISAGAAHSGSPELVLLVWEVLEHCNYRPTEAIYENTIIAFASAGNHLQTAFGAINSMKEDGFEVSRSLLRSFSLALR